MRHNKFTSVNKIKNNQHLINIRMSKNNRSFQLKGLERTYDDTHKDRFVSFLVPVDQDEPDGFDPEEILSFIRIFNSKISGL